MSWLVAFLLPLFLIACDTDKKECYSPVYTSTPNNTQAVLIFGVHPLHNPQRLYETYGPLVEYLNRNLPELTIQLEASRSYEEFDKKLYGRHFHFALPNPYQTLNSLQHGYHIFAKMGEDEKFRGIIIVRKDSKISTVADLKDKIVSFPAPTALAATMMPLYYLHTHGLDVNKDITRLFSGSQESSIMNVYLRKSAAGATWPPPWQSFVERNPKIAADLEVKWESPPLLNNGLVARDDVAPEVVDKVKTLLLNLHTHEEGRQLLSALPLMRFESATEATYQPVRDFMKKYTETVH
ncbi:MAG: phosphate/phosphite/phosphonate ABC transporter substrate-binding protein [Proteobacteria bacterium]|nr:phosphate/phosphite/phosphonate ABC transporter substrate-binding protein [Pseudomonadota bacterium]MBU1650329.1 phosphate/phosphite/phosphonate ABC transporter substrate-binding protein [Pseudomonadota bacterium]